MLTLHVDGITSDTHFSHANVIRYSRQQFLQPGDLDDTGGWVSKEVKRARADEMDEYIIARHNEVIPVDGRFLHLGDVAPFCSPSRLSQYLTRMNGHVFLVPGNHDDNITGQLCTQLGRSKLDILNRLESVTLTDGVITVDAELCHNAMRTWYRQQRGAIQLYGHSHDSLPELDGLVAMDVGLESANRQVGELRPFTLKEIVAILNKKKFKAQDHHGTHGDV